MMQFRLLVIKIICTALLPRDFWVGKHFGAYTNKYRITFGRLDGRGVLQGMLEKDIN